MARRAVARRAGILDTKVDTEAGQAAEMHPLVQPKFSDSFSGPSWTRTRSQWIKNPIKASPSVTNGENTGGAQCPIATDQTPDAVSKPLRALSRSTLIASLYDHASALAKAGDIGSLKEPRPHGISEVQPPDQLSVQSNTS
jgi:hypothetical protein